MKNINPPGLFDDHLSNLLQRNIS